MAIDFCVDYPCDAKQVLGADGLLDLVHARIAYDAVRHDPTPRGDTEFWKRVVRGPRNDHVQMVTVGQLRRKSNRLIEFTSGCEGCPANVRGGPAGCFGRVTYPIDSPTERHLAAGAAALSDLPAPAPARVFIQWIEDGPVDGRRVQAMRDASRRGVRFLELTDPLTIRLSATASPSTPTRPLTTDQIIEMIFFTFPTARGGFHFELPSEALSGHRAFFDFILNELDLGHRRAALEQSTTFEQIRLFARAVAVAESLKVDVLVD